MLARTADHPAFAARGRDFATVAAFVASVGLAGQAVLLSMTAADAPAQKATARMDAGPIEKRELVYYPQELAADESLRGFRPGSAWTPEAIQPPVAETLAVASFTVASLAVAPAVAQLKPVRAKNVVSLRRPPARAATLAHAAPTSPHQVATTSHAPSKSTAFWFGKFVPTGADIMRGLGAVGTSIGKIVRISAR